MKKTGWKHLVRTIQKNKVSFFSVAFIATVAVALYVGIQSATTAAFQSADRYYVEKMLETLEITSSTGFTTEDIEMLQMQDGVDLAEGGYSEMVIWRGEQENLIIQALSLFGGMNVPTLIEGTLPKNAGEVAMEEIFAIEQGVKVGDEIILEHDGQLVSDTFQVTAIINQPMFCCGEVPDTRGISTKGLGAAEYYIQLPEEAFNSAYYYGRFMKAYVRNNALDEVYYYSEEYAEKETAFIEQLEEEFPEDWTFYGRSNVGDIRALKEVLDGMNGISYALSLIFLFVSTVVCHAAITRMIDDQKILIGTQKAQGFVFREILTHYLLYNILCAVLGVVLGWLIAYGIIETVILFILKSYFLFDRMSYTFLWKEAMIATAICLAVFVTATYMVCARLIRLPARILLMGETPTQNKGFFFEKWKGYQKLSLYSRTMIKNVLCDKGRMASTIMGVTGCIALLVICFSLKIGMDGAFSKQFKEYFFYENRLVIDTEKGSAEEFQKVLEEEQVAYLKVQNKMKSFCIEEGVWESAYILTVNDTEKLEDFVFLEDIESKKRMELPEEGLLVSRKCAENYGLSEGSVVKFVDSKGDLKEGKIAGIVEYYLSHYFFAATDSYYEEMMGEPADSSVFLLQGSIDGLQEKVQGLDGFLLLRDNTNLKDNSDAIIMVIGVCLALSAVMAVLVLMNQITMHINRKSRELAVMRINGYTLKETKAYVYKDNIVLTVMGMIIGCSMGVGLAYLVVQMIETEAAHYVRTPSLSACLMSCVIGGIFAFLVNVIALRRIHTLNLTNVNGN